MAIDPIADSPAPQGSGLARKNLAANFDEFLNLLITQLQHQDPLSPMSTSEFTSQIVQFAAVEQTIATNTNLELLIGLHRASQAASAIDYLGKRIEADGDTTPLVDGYAEWNYALAEQAQTVTLTITADNGTVVYDRPGANDLGAHRLVWDGTDTNGDPLPEGDYTLRVTARGADGAVVAATTTVVGTVSGIQTSGDELLLFVARTGIPLGKVIAILDARPATALRI